MQHGRDRGRVQRHEEEVQVQVARAQPQRPQQVGCKTEPNYKKLYKECLKRWDMKDLGQGAADLPPDRRRGTTASARRQRRTASPTANRWRETIRLAATTGCLETQGITKEHLLHRRLLRGRHTLVGLHRHDMDGVQCGRRSRELSHDNPKCSKYSENKKKCKKKWRSTAASGRSRHRAKQIAAPTTRRCTRPALRSQCVRPISQKLDVESVCGAFGSVLHRQNKV